MRILRIRFRIPETDANPIQLGYRRIFDQNAFAYNWSGWQALACHRLEEFANSFFVYFFSGLECVGHFFAYSMSPIYDFRVVSEKELRVLP
jgi:hypothetical protein